MKTAKRVNLGRVGSVNVAVVWTAVVLAAMGLACNGGGGNQVRTDAGGDRDASDASDGEVNVITDSGPEVGTPGITPVKLMVSPATVMVNEGAMMPGTFAVTLSQPWSAPITVTLVSANPNVATVIPETLTFGPNKTGPEMVMVLPTLDEDAADNTTSITLFSQETGSANVTVEVDDMDVQGLLVSPPRVSMTEGRSETLNVRLARRPASAVVVTLTSSNAAKLALAQTTLTFNAGNYAVPQLVTMTAAQDDDASLDTVTVNLTATGNIPAFPVQVEITDDDAVNLDVTPPSLNLVERANMPGTINVRLTRAPSADVTVAVVSSLTAKATVTPASLTFTPANFDTVQTVQVAAVNDNDARDEMATVTLTATGVSPAPPARTVSVTIDDPDSQMLQVTPTTLPVAEGASTSFDVRLLLDPGGPVTVNVFSQNPGKIEILPPVLNFTGANFGTVQTVMVRSLHDEDLANDNINVTLAASTAANVNVTVNVTDDDTQAIQLIPVTPGDPLVMQESLAGGPASTSPLAVRLAYRPEASTTVNLTSSDPKLTASPATLTFTPSNYALAQFVTLGAPHDMDMVNDTATLTARATGVADTQLGVQLLDTDIQNFNVSVAGLGPIPEGMTGQFIVRLTVMPSAPVMANVGSNRDGKVSVSPGLCVLTTANFATGCLVTVTAVEETPDDTRDETATISIADVTGVIAPRSVAVAVDDTDTQALVVTPLATNPVMEGAATTFTVRLMYNPIDPVSVSVFSQSPTKLEVGPPVLNFNASNFAAPQTVSITALQDDDLVSEGPSSVPPARITVAGLAAGAANAIVDVNIMDNDTQAILLTPTSSEMSRTVIQEGAMTQVGIRLAFRPAADVTVTLTSSSTTLLTTAVPSVTFTPMNYSVTQFVMLSALDENNMVDDNVTVTASATGITSAVHYVRITDTDVLNFDLSPMGGVGTIVEGTSTTFVVRLTVMPASPVTPQLASSNPAVTATFASGCMLNAGNYMTGCTVNVAAVEDLNALDETATITVSDPAATDAANMRPIASRTVSAASDDNDTQAIVLEGAANPEILSEGGGTQNFVVKLAADPVTPVTITFTPSLGSQVTVASTPSPCVLTTTNYTATGCAVTVTGLEDLDLVDQNLSVRVSASIAVSDAFVNIRKTDNDTQALVLRDPTVSMAGVESCGGEVPRLPSAPVPSDTNTTITVTEENAVGRKVCVALAFQPDVTNTVTATPSAATIGVAPVSLDFNNTNYFISQAFTVTGTMDANTANATGTVTVSVVPLAPEKTIDVDVLDNDRILTVTPTAGGQVNSSPAGIDGCTSSSAAGTCNEAYVSAMGQTVTLTATPNATPAPGWSFGAFAGGAGDCSDGSVSVSAVVTCTATFRPNFAVTVSGMGTVSTSGGTPGSGGQISACATTCSTDFTIGDSVTMTATPAAGWMFSAWSGTGCVSGTVNANMPRSCTATFVEMTVP